MSDLDEILDNQGVVRRLGSWTKPANFVSAFKTVEDEHPLYDDDQIKAMITDPNRMPARVQFDSSWVLNQGSYGSCNGHAGASALAEARVRRGLPKLLLSGAYLYSLINGGRDQGSMLEDGLLAVQKNGVAPLSMVPANEIYPNQQPPGVAAEAAKRKALVAFAVQTKQGLRSALAAGFPCIVAVHVGGRFSTLHNGICGVDGGGGNHAVMVDDLRIINGTEVYDMQNSWGLGFADRGRGYLVWDHFVQTFNSHVFYAIASTEEAGE